MHSRAICNVAESAADSGATEDDDITKKGIHKPVPFAHWLGRIGTETFLPRAARRLVGVISLAAVIGEPHPLRCQAYHEARASASQCQKSSDQRQPARILG